MNPEQAETPPPIELPVHALSVEQEIGELLRVQSRLVLGKLLALSQDPKADLHRTMRLISAYVEVTNGLLAEFRAPDAPGTFLTMPGRGPFALGGMGGAMETAMSAVTEALAPGVEAQRLQALTGAYQSATKAGDTELATQFRRRIDDALNGTGDADVLDAVPLPPKAPAPAEILP